MTDQNDILQNPHLEGDSFFWEAGPIGILLLHGLTATTAEVRLLATALHQRGYTISAPLLPGHGTNPEDLNTTTWHQWAWEAEKSYNHLATLCQHVFVGGESTGGVLALHLATRFPEIAGILCYAPAIKLAMPFSKVVQLYTVAQLVAAIPKENVDSNPNWQGYKVNPLRAVMELVRLGRDVRNHLSEITQPVLVMQGRNDQTVAADVGDIILDGIQSSHTAHHWLENSGHVILLEDELPQIIDLTLAFMTEALDT